MNRRRTMIRAAVASLLWLIASPAPTFGFVLDSTVGRARPESIGAGPLRAYTGFEYPYLRYVSKYVRQNFEIPGPPNARYVLQSLYLPAVDVEEGATLEVWVNATAPDPDAQPPHPSRASGPWSARLVDGDNLFTPDLVVGARGDFWVIPATDQFRSTVEARSGSSLPDGLPHGILGTRVDWEYFIGPSIPPIEENPYVEVDTQLINSWLSLRATFVPVPEPATNLLLAFAMLLVAIALRSPIEAIRASARGA